MIDGLTGKPDAVKVARPVWVGGKPERAYLSTHIYSRSVMANAAKVVGSLTL